MLLILLATGTGVCEDAMQILGKVGQTYSGLKSYHFEGATVSETTTERARSTSESEFVVAYSAPNKFKVEYRYPNAGNWIRVSDGRTLFRYRSITRELEQKAADTDDLDILNGTFVVGFQSINLGVKKAALLDPEPVTIGEQKFDCYVIEVERERHNMLPGMEPLPEKLWIDKARFIVLRQVTGTKSVTQSSGSGTENIRTTAFSVARINEPIDDDLFAFNAKVRR